MSVERKIVLKVGGSVLYDDTLNVNFNLLEKVKVWYLHAKKEYSKIVLVVGGGNLSRELQKKVINQVDSKDALHNIAMSVTQTSAEVLKGFLDDDSIYIPKTLGDAYEYLMEDKARVVLSGGLKAGWSTDMDSSIFADIISVDRVVKISNIDYLYDSDPKNNPNAKIIKEISWQEYFNLFDIKDTDEHSVNASIPVDKECAKFSANKGISFFICGGKNIVEKDSIESILSEGSLIYP